jgi:hypothetical protein
MKQSLFIVMVLVSLFLPWACSDNNNNPTKPTLPSAPGTPTMTFTISPTPMNTGTPTPSAQYTSTITFTPTATSTFLAPPVYTSQWKTASNPTGFYLVPGVGLMVSEGVTGEYPSVMIYNTVTGTLITQTNFVVSYIPSGPNTIIFNNVLGVGITPNNSDYTIIDGASNGGATVYTGSSLGICDIATGVSYGNSSTDGEIFNNPQGFAFDNNTYYVADTGNHQVDQFNPPCGPYVCPIHWWSGGPKQTFIKPSALCTDPSGNVYVADPGYNPSIIQEFYSSSLSGGVTYVGQFTTVTNCVVSGMAIDPATPTHLYVSDIANNQVEEYDITNISTNNVNLIRKWGNQVSNYEFTPFLPTCIAVDDPNNNILVGDSDNRLVNVFKGL